jgi:hypothetical protein
MIQFRFPGFSILGVDSQGQGDAFFKVFEADYIDFIVRVDFIVVGGAGKCQGEHSLFLEIGFVDTGE